MIDHNELRPLLEEVETMLQDLWESALVARDAAQEVLDNKQKSSMRLMQIQIEAQRENFNDLPK